MKLFKSPYTIDEISRNILTGGHVLIAGATGSGKSTMLETFLYCLTHESPTNYQFCIIDLKRVSLTRWKRCPHIKYYATTPEQARYIIQLTIDTMYSRLVLMEKEGTQKYNGTKLFLIIDESADLLSSCKDILPQLVKIGRLARATNISMVYCTQSPSRAAIPSSIQTNISVQIALRCRDKIASRQIIGATGAETLPRFGECLYYTPDNGTIKHVKAVRISDQEIEKHLTYIKRAGYSPKMIKPQKPHKFSYQPIFSRFLDWLYS